jgi:hypothetical protein
MSRIFAALVAALAILAQTAAVAAAGQGTKQPSQFAGVVKRLDRTSKTLVVTVTAPGRSTKRAARSKKTSEMRFDVGAARIKGADANGDGSVDLADLARGQAVHVVINRSSRLRKSRRRGLLRATTVTAKSTRSRHRSTTDDRDDDSASSDQDEDADEDQDEDQDEDDEIDLDSILATVGGASLHRIDASSGDASGTLEDTGAADENDSEL